MPGSILGILRDITPVPDSLSVRQIFLALKQQLPRTVLTRLALDSDDDDGLGPPKIAIDDLRLLFHFTNLTFVQLLLPTGIDISDDDVLSLAQAWPRLEALELRQQLDDTPPVGITLRSLLHLAEHCSNLAQLDLCVDGSTVPPIARSTHGARLLHHALISWTVGPSSISAPFEVARFLSAIFPALTGVCVNKYDDREEDEAEGWDAVRVALPICHEMRAEERFWVERQEANARTVEL
ncbi:hypothetical protein C8R46DRAFT_1024366 [Mycena filopes]|nr:hypothetical protein C8R46DRAFT_1024366 [Mycena filopes]